MHSPGTLPRSWLKWRVVAFTGCGWEQEAESPSQKGKEAVGGGTVPRLGPEAPRTCYVVSLDFTYKTGRVIKNSIQ